MIILNLTKFNCCRKKFFTEPSENGKEYIINESLAKELFKDNPKKPVSWLLGKNFGFDSIGTIVGIAKDFNFNSLHYKIETMFLYNQKDWGFSNISVKINGNKAKETLAFIQSVWQKNFPGHPFEYQFLDEHFKKYIVQIPRSAILLDTGSTWRS